MLARWVMVLELFFSWREISPWKRGFQYLVYSGLSLLNNIYIGNNIQETFPFGIYNRFSTFIYQPCACQFTQFTCSIFASEIFRTFVWDYFVFSAALLPVVWHLNDGTANKLLNGRMQPLSVNEIGAWTLVWRKCYKSTHYLLTKHFLLREGERKQPLSSSDSVVAPDSIRIFLSPYMPSPNLYCQFLEKHPVPFLLTFFFVYVEISLAMFLIKYKLVEEKINFIFHF